MLSTVSHTKNRGLASGGASLILFCCVFLFNLVRCLRSKERIYAFLTENDL